MLAQHRITRPVFKALFAGHQFTEENPVSRAMQQVLDVLDENRIDKETRDLEKFYDSVRNRAHGKTNPQAKQRPIVELYDKFFRNAFPRTTEKLGIVYTPVEIVDFILHSVNEMLQEHFGQSLGSKGVHIIDPFTGTGTFITRLLQSRLIAPEELEHKYRHEIHANEIVLLAYYIAAINIEAVYQGEGKKNGNVSFEGICLTDTFQMYEGKNELALYMPDNSERRTRQKDLDIRVIVGNPPYSVGQSTANDDNANVVYPGLDERIRETYAARSVNTNMRSLYDGYVRAIRWASDRIGDAGVVAFVTNAGWVDGGAADGMRACLAEEFTDLYAFHLRGNQRTSGERSRKEGGKIFGSGSRAPIAICVFVRNPDATEHGCVFFHDIGDYLDQKQKLAVIRSFNSVSRISAAKGWARVEPDDHNDWLEQRDSSFEHFISASAKKEESGIFETHSTAIKTNRDAWVYSRSESALRTRMSSAIKFFNQQSTDIQTGVIAKVDADSKKFKWCQSTLRAAERGRKFDFHPELIQVAVYRPFEKAFLYKDKNLNWSAYLMPKFYPERGVENFTICTAAPGNVSGFTAMMDDTVPDLCLAAMKSGSQCFPL